MNSELKQVYDNTYTSYESERQSRTDRAEAKKKKKNENIHKQLKKREDCLKKAVVTKGSELEKIADEVSRRVFFNTGGIISYFIR
jgi:DNA-binding helix-hairpin-helix protein with protein kinase domain